MATQEVAQEITKIVNPRTGEPFTLTEAQRILRADMKRRVRAAKYMQQYRANRNGK